mgnify:CR=1 FL=1
MDVCLDVQKLRWWPFQKRRGPETVVQRPWHLLLSLRNKLSANAEIGAGRVGELGSFQSIEKLEEVNVTKL